MSSPTTLDATAIAALYPSGTEKARELIVVPQIQHRIDLITRWGITAGERVLEIGCGQGDTTITLAAAVGQDGHVTAIDPASLDYGSPYTLGQAQAHLRVSSLGDRIQFVQADPIVYLSQNSEKFSTAILSHCIWYFSSPTYLVSLLSELSTRVERICIAEWALRSSDPRSIPHVLTALAQATMEAHKKTSTANIRTVLSPAGIKSAAQEAGLSLVSEDIFTPVEGMADGRWEVHDFLADSWPEAQLNKYVENEREKAAIVAMRDAVKAHHDVLVAKGEKVKSMDAWCGVFVKA